MFFASWDGLLRTVVAGAVAYAALVLTVIGRLDDRSALPEVRGPHRDQ